MENYLEMLWLLAVWHYKLPRTHMEVKQKLVQANAHKMKFLISIVVSYNMFLDVSSPNSVVTVTDTLTPGILSFK